MVGSISGRQTLPLVSRILTSSIFTRTFAYRPDRGLSRPRAWRHTARYPVKLHPDDIVGYQGIDYRVEGILDYHLDDRILRLARMVGQGQVRFLEPAEADLVDRVLILAEILNLDITAPPPSTIYHHGESYLLKIAGTATVIVAGTVEGQHTGPCALWRYKAAGGQFLQIEQWSDKVRMLAGTSVHKDMLEVRPATLQT
jgi:hypothetical protein